MVSACLASLAILWLGNLGASSLVVAQEVDADSIPDARLKAAGIRKLEGRHLTLYTDLPPADPTEQLPGLFDMAVPLWCEYFELEPSVAANWKMTGCLIRRKERFLALGLLPDDLPPFLHGFERGDTLWMNEQPTDYYTRHLLLHEGTHAFMKQFLGGAGPPWYMEGMAELLGTHRLRDGQLTLGVFPADKAETPGWGRIKIVKDELSAGRGMRLTGIMQYGARAHLRNEPYGWCWAAAAFLDAHPRTRSAFRGLREHAGEIGIEFSRRFYQQLAAEWPAIRQDWQLFVMNLEYGYDVARNSIDSKPERPLPPDGAVFRVQAGRGWQSTGLVIDANRTYDLTAVGRYQVATTTEPWMSEPGGVTIRYVGGRPLGQLLAGVSDERVQLTGLLKPIPVGSEAKLQVESPGILYLKVNDSPAELRDNDGVLTVRVVAN